MNGAVAMNKKTGVVSAIDTTPVCI